MEWFARGWRRKAVKRTKLVAGNEAIFAVEPEVDPGALGISGHGVEEFNLEPFRNGYLFDRCGPVFVDG